jgi:hypothetical protein
MTNSLFFGFTEKLGAQPGRFLPLCQRNPQSERTNTVGGIGRANHFLCPLHGDDCLENFVKFYNIIFKPYKNEKINLYF